MYYAIPLKYRLLVILVLCQCFIAFSQAQEWNIISPLRDSIVANNNLFVSVTLKDYNISSDCMIFLDNRQLVGNMKVAGNRMSFVHAGQISSGRHYVVVRTFVKSIKRIKEIGWSFYVNSRSGNSGYNSSNKSGLSIEGVIQADNRSSQITGKGAAYRQEPGSTRTVMLDMKAKYKDLEIPVRIFATSDQYPGILPRNYFQVGLHYRWLQLDYGDLNPTLDQLVVSGVRVTGFGMKIRMKKNSIQAFYGDMVKNGIEGSLNTYKPGSGYIPTARVNDSQYISPGVYKRWMAATRIQVVTTDETIHVGLTAMKAKDEVNSIQYGLMPKDNIAMGLDASVNVFKKRVTISAGMAGSILTDDISYGPLNKQLVNSAFNLGIKYDFSKIKNLIVINSSTVPGSSKAIDDAMAYYAQVTHTKGSHSFTVDYRSYGPSYYSLGNPYLRNNYKGISLTERFGMLKRKLGFSMNYQNYVNNLNSALAFNVNTTVYNGSAFVNVSPKVPAVVFSYMRQQRNSVSFNSKIIANVNDRVDYYMANFTYHLPFKGIVQPNIRTTFLVNNRQDLVNPQYKSDMLNYLVGAGISIINKINLTMDGGRTVIKDYQKKELANVFTYSLFGEWQIKPRVVFTSMGISNNKTMATLYSPQSTRMSYIFRVGARLLRGMGIDVEGGYTPYKEAIFSANNYDETYVYLRYKYNFSFR